MPLELSEPFFQNIEEKEAFYSLIEGCRYQVKPFVEEKKSSVMKEEEEIPSQVGQNANGNIFYLTLTNLFIHERYGGRLFSTLLNNLDLIGRCLTFSQRKSFINSYLLGFYFEKSFEKF